MRLGRAGTDKALLSVYPVRGMCFQGTLAGDVRSGHLISGMLCQASPLWGETLSLLIVGVLRGGAL